MSEHFGSSTSPDPNIVREAWEQADSAPGGPDWYSLRAVQAAVVNRGELFGPLFANFGTVNFKPESFYEEGTSYADVVGRVPLSGSFTLGRSSAGTGSVTKNLDHLSNRFVVFKPGRGVNEIARLRVAIDGPGSRSRPGATLLLFKSSGETTRKSIVLDDGGDGRASVSFAKSAVTKVVLVLTNGSTRYDCWVDRSSPYSCRGFSKDDGKLFVFSGRLVQ